MNSLTAGGFEPAAGVGASEGEANEGDADAEKARAVLTSCAVRGRARRAEVERIMMGWRESGVW